MSDDLCRCPGGDCPSKDRCLRFNNVKASGPVHWVFSIPPFDVSGSCEHFVPLLTTQGSCIESTVSTIRNTMTDQQKIMDDVRDERSADYGDFRLNMLALNKVIEAMLMQAFQQEFVLPDEFSCRVMAAHKMLRQIHGHKDDNIIDRKNYDRQGDEML